MSHLVVSDPSDISSRFSNSDRLGVDSILDVNIEEMIDRDLVPSPEEDLLKEGVKPQFSAVQPYLHRIPIREKDLIVLYYRDEMKQEQIARLFGITQAAVSYRLHRGIKRIQFLRTIPELDEDDFKRDLGSWFSPQDMEILWRMYETTCQSAIAKEMSLTQGRVRHRFFRALSRIKELIAQEIASKAMVNGLESTSNPDEFAKKLNDLNLRTESIYSRYYLVFYAISDKRFNILHEVSLPQFKDRGDAQIISIAE
ncbi:MAG TPA: sigma-70 family RNA polymerase sigma factor [Methylobacter sp.]|jgi:DNA-directed RNA polymerase specialized sigma24 family protein